jgi:SAM-dependent methyltransferase
MELARYDDVIAHYYDAGYAVLPGLGADVAFYRALAAGAGGPVLELGCGTGRVLARIAEDGHACTGLDASPAMLARLRARAPGVRTVEGDMRDFDLGGARFALIYSAFRAFQHLEEVEDQLRCLACVRTHLAAGARFAFDVFNPRLDLLASDDDSEFEDLRFEQDGEDIARYARVARDRARQCLRVAFRYERRASGRVVGDAHAEVTMRWFYRYELLHLMHRAGFAEVEIHGDFDGSPVSGESPALVVVAQQEAT